MGKDSVRKTIYISDELQRKLEQESIVADLSQTEMIRRAIAVYLEIRAVSRGAGTERTAAAGDMVRELAEYLDEEEGEKRKKRRSLLGSLAGLIEDDDLPEDLARGHDKYLYGGEG